MVLGAVVLEHLHGGEGKAVSSGRAEAVHVAVGAGSRGADDGSQPVVFYKFDKIFFTRFQAFFIAFLFAFPPSASAPRRMKACPAPG